MHANILDIQITEPQPRDVHGNQPGRKVTVTFYSKDPLAVLAALSSFFGKTSEEGSVTRSREIGARDNGEPARRAPPKDPLVDAIRPGGTPASPQRRALEDAAAESGGVVTHAAGAVPVVVPRGEEPEGVETNPVGVVVERLAQVAEDLKGSPYVQPEAVAAESPVTIPDFKAGDVITLSSLGGKEPPEELRAAFIDAGGSLTVQKVSKRKDHLAAVVEKGWALKLVQVGSVLTLQGAQPTVSSSAKAPPRVEQLTAAASPTAAPAESVEGSLEASVAKARTLMPELVAADALRSVIQALLAAGIPREHILGVCQALQPDVPMIKKQPSLKDRVPRLLMIETGV